MTGGPSGEIVEHAIAWETTPRSAVVLDAIYAPRETPLLARARARRLAAADGLKMLVSQGALAFELWLGVSAPREAMLAAVC
jgi:shikimate dehydrogenase